MRVLVALGGNALLRKGEPPTAEAQRANVRIAAANLAPIAGEHDLVISHGNGPQVGLLALQAASFLEVAPYPLDLLGAQTEGMIGYMIEQELGNLLPIEVPIATMLSMVEVDPADPAFLNPTKPIGPVYSESDAARLSAEKGWAVAKNGNGWRRVVASPRPKRIFETRPIRWLLERGCIVICGGGGGIPTAYTEDGRLVGIEAVVDKDLASCVLATELGADIFLMATDADGVYLDWGTPQARRVARISPEELQSMTFEAGSMGPKAMAAAEFVLNTGRPAAIGSLEDLQGMLDGTGGTRVEQGASLVIA